MPHCSVTAWVFIPLSKHYLPSSKFGLSLILYKLIQLLKISLSTEPGCHQLQVLLGDTEEMDSRHSSSKAETLE